MTRAEKRMRFTFVGRSGSVVRETSARNPWRTMAVLAGELTAADLHTLGVEQGDTMTVDLVETVEVRKRAEVTVDLRLRVHKVRGFAKVKETSRDDAE